MKNKLSDIFSAFALTLPLAMLAGALSLGVDSGSAILFLAATGGTLLLAWPALALHCQHGREVGRRHTFRLHLVGSLLLLPLAASVIMFRVVELPGGYAGGIVFMIMCAAGATTVLVGWLGAAIICLLGGREVAL